MKALDINPISLTAEKGSFHVNVKLDIGFKKF